MKIELLSADPRFRMLPVAATATSEGLLIRRGSTAISFNGAAAAEAVQVIAARAASGPVTKDELLDQFARRDQPAAERIVAKLIERRFLVPVDATVTSEAETQFDIFYWHLDTSRSAVDKRTADRRIAIVGVNLISRRLLSALQEATGFRAVVVDYPLLANLRLYDGSGRLDERAWPPGLGAPVEYRAWAETLDEEPIDCLIATSDFGGLQLMRQWNAFCVQNEVHFLPVVVQDLVGHIGPFVVPGETACFECARGRQNSHLLDPDAERAAEERAFEEQRVAALHPAIPNVVAELAAVELAKFYGGWFRSPSAGNAVEMNLLSMEMTSHLVLKLPRCTVCSNLLRRSSTAIEVSPFLPGNDPRQ